VRANEEIGVRERDEIETWGELERRRGDRGGE